MSTRPDLTTEELIRWCERRGVVGQAIAQRLRSERQAVTPETLTVEGMTLEAVEYAAHFWNAQLESRLAALSVFSTEGKP